MTNRTGVAPRTKLSRYDLRGSVIALSLAAGVGTGACGALVGRRIRRRGQNISELRGYFRQEIRVFLQRCIHLTVLLDQLLLLACQSILQIADLVGYISLLCIVLSEIQAQNSLTGISQIV